MRSAHLSPWVRCIVGVAAFAALLAVPALASDRVRTVASSRGATPIRSVGAPAVANQPNGVPNPITAGPWTQLGPFNQMGRMKDRKSVV